MTLNRTTIKIKYLGSGTFALDAMLNYPRQFIRHSFTHTGELLDVTDIASPDELNRNPVITNLRDPARPGGALIQVIVTPGNDDIDGAGFGTGPNPESSAALSVVAGGGAAAGTAALYARGDHVHDIAALAVGTAELAAGGVTLAKLAAAVQQLLASVLVFGTGAAQAGATVFAAPGSGDGSTSVELQVPVTRAGVLRNLYVKCQTAPGSGHTDVITVRKNGVNTTLTATVADAATTANDTSHTVSVVAGDLISVQIAQGSSSVGANYECAFDFAVA